MRFMSWRYLSVQWLSIFPESGVRNLKVSQTESVFTVARKCQIMPLGRMEWEPDRCSIQLSQGRVREESLCTAREIRRQQGPLKTPSRPRKPQLFARGLQSVRPPSKFLWCRRKGFRESGHPNQAAFSRMTWQAAW